MWQMAIDKPSNGAGNGHAGDTADRDLKPRGHHAFEHLDMIRLAHLDDQGALDPCLAPPAYPFEDEQIACEDTGIEPQDTDREVDEPEDESRCGCTGPVVPTLGWVAILCAALLGLRRRED